MADLSRTPLAHGLVSVVIPLYNGEKYIAHAIKSVLNQTYENTEIICVDDGSPDNSAGIAKGFGSQVIVIKKENGGVASARNAGIAESKGEFVAFLDQDDWWDDRKLQLQMEQFNVDPDIGLVHSHVTYYDADGQHPQPLLNERAGTHEIVGCCFDRLLLGNGIYNSSVVVRRSTLEAVGTCDLSIPGNTVQDYDLWLRIAKKYPFAVVDEPVTKLRLHGEQGIWNRSAMLEAELAVLFKNCPKRQWRSAPARRVRLANLYDEIGVAYRDAGVPAKGRKYFFEAMATTPSFRSLSRWTGSWLPLWLTKVIGW